MKTVLLSILLASGVSVDSPVPKQSKPDAGVVKNQVSDGGYEYSEAKRSLRRANIESSVRGMAADVSKATQTSVTVKYVMFATAVVDDERDAAIFVIQDNAGLVAMFTMYRNGQWQTLPEDFR